MVKVLWLSPNFNHYKARFLNLLSQEAELELSVLRGTGRNGYGDKEIEKGKKDKGGKIKK